MKNLILCFCLMAFVACKGDDNKALPTMPEPVAFTGATISAGQVAVGLTTCTLRVVGEWTGGLSPFTVSWSSTSTRLPGNPSQANLAARTAALDITAPRGSTAIREDMRITMNLTGADGGSYRTETTVQLACPAGAALASSWATAASTMPSWGWEVQ